MGLLDGLLQLLSPASCAGCEIALGPGLALFCGGCEPLLELPSQGQRPPAPSSAGFVFGGPLAEAVRRFKYQGRCELGRPLGELLAARALPFAGRIDCVMPIPLHPERLRERGYNQSALLARPLSRALGVPLDVRTLVRVRPTRVQAGLPREARLQNVEGAFRARLRGPAMRVLLIDDVRTTGATLAAAAAALRASGVRQISNLALARADA
jgi:ComF family protein